MHKIRAKTLHSQITDQIREMISSGALVPGQKISEQSLCDVMGVSRTPVRESLRILHSEGLVQLIPQRGAFVNEPCIEEINDMFTVMSVLEGMCARLATERMKEEDFLKIEALHLELETHYADRNHEAYLKTNHTYHVLIQELSGNAVLHQVVDGLRAKILLYRQRQLYQPDRFDQSMREHRTLLEAFRERDGLLAEKSMKRHLINQCNALVGLYASRKIKTNAASGDESNPPIPNNHTKTRSTP